MHKIASFLQRNSSKDTLNTDSVHDGDESLENIERSDHRKLSIKKQEEFHKTVLKYINSNDTSNNPSDIYSNQTLNCLKWFMKQSQITSSIGKDLKLYLKKALPIFASLYHKYHNKISNYYQFSFILDNNDDSSFSLFDINSNHNKNDNKNKNINIELELLETVSKSSIHFINIFYDLLTKSNIKISLSNDIESIVTDLLSVIIALTHISLTNTDKNIWNDINLSLKLFTGICNNLPLQTIAIFEEHQFILFWKILCNFIKYIINNADKQPKMWILSQRLLKIILVLTESNCNKLSQIFIKHKLLYYFKDIFSFLLAKSKLNHTISHKIHHLICCIIHRILEIINVLLHSTNQSQTIHRLCQELGFWKNTKIYLIRIIPIINITESNSIQSHKRKFVSVHDWINVFQRLIAVSIINGCVHDEHRDLRRKSSIDSIDEQTKSLSHSLMTSIIPRSHYSSVSSSHRNNRIKQNDILTQHIIPIFITVIDNHSDKHILLIQILNHLKTLLCSDDANWEVFIRYNYFDQLFASYPINDNYQSIHQELYQVLKLCIVQYIYNSNNDKHNDLYTILLRFMKELQSKVLYCNAIHCIQFIEFLAKCVQSHSYFGHIFYDLKIINEVINLLTNCQIPRINLYLNMPFTPPITSTSSSPINQEIVFTVHQMQSLFHFLSLITEYHTANCTELGLSGICTVLSLLKNAKYHKQIFKIISRILNTFNLQEDKSTFAYYCHGIIILLTRILQDKDTSVLSKIFVMKYLQYIGQQYKQAQHSFCIINGFSTILSCFECEYTTPHLTDIDHIDHNMKEIQLIYVQELMVTFVSMARDDTHLSKLLQSEAFIKQFNVQINRLCSCIEDDIFKQLMVQWIMWISLDYIPDKTKEQCRITLSADLEHYTIRSLDVSQLQFPTTRQFYYPRFAVIALDLLVQCAPKFQQFGLCLFQNFVKRHLNRNRLSSVNFIQTLCHHIGIWLNMCGEISSIDTQPNDPKELTQMSLIPDYIFLLSIVGTASRNTDLKTILSLYQISHDITKKQMKPNSERHRYPYGALMSDTLLKILHNENNESFIEFEHNYNGYSYFELPCFDIECTLNMMLQIIVLDQPINLWTLKKSRKCYYQCIINATEMLICIGNDNSLQKIRIKKIGISVGIWQCYTFIFNANHNRNRYKLNKSNCVCLDVYLNGELKECINLATPSFLSSSSSFIIGRHENELSVSDTEWKLGNLQLFEKALKPGHISTLYYDKLQSNVDRLIYRQDSSIDLTYSLSPKNVHNKRNLINLINEQNVKCNGDVSICECRSLSVTLLEMGGIPILFDIIESSLTTYSLNRILELIGELIEEQANIGNNNKTLLLMPLVAVSSHCNSIHVFAYSLKKVIHLADSSTVSILFRLCGFHNDCTRGIIVNKLQRSIFEAVFLDNKTQKIWNSARISIETYQYLYKCFCNLVTVHNEKDSLIKYLTNTCCMVIQIISQVDNDDFSINLLNPAINLLKCLLLKSKNLNQIKLLVDTIIGMKVSADSDTSNKNIFRKNKINLLLKMLLDININKNRIMSLKMIVSLLQTPLYTDKICDNKQDLLTAQYVLLLSTSMFLKNKKEKETILLKLRDSGTIMAFVQSLKPFIESKDCSIIIILLHVLVGKPITNEEVINIQQTYSDSSIIEMICKDVHHILLPEIFLIILQSKHNGEDALMEDIPFICKQILIKIKNWGSGCTLALVLDMTQAIYTLSINDANNTDNIDCLQFFVNKAIRQLLKTQDDLEWFFVEILFTSVSGATQSQLVHFHTMFLQSLLIHISKYISYKTLKQNVVLSANLPLIFKIVCGCFLSNTFMNTSLLLDTIISFIIRYSETGKIPIELFKIFNKICICILSQTLIKVKENDLYDALNIILKNKKMVLSTNNKDEEFFVSLTYSLYKLYNTSSQSTRTLCMKIWEYLILSQQSIVQPLLMYETNDESEIQLFEKNDNQDDNAYCYVMDVYRDGFCKYLLYGEYDKFEKWLSCNQVLMEKIFGTKCLEIFNDEVTNLDHEFAILSTSPINNKRRSSTIIECKNINKIRMNRFKKHELRLINNLSRSHIAYQSVIYASKHLKYQLKMFNFISTCNHSVFREPKWSRNQVYGSYNKYPPRLKFFPLIINQSNCKTIKSPKIWPRQSQIPSSSSHNSSIIRRGTILSQFHELLDNRSNKTPPNKANKQSTTKTKQRLLSIKNPDLDTSRITPLTKSPKVIYGQFKDFSKSLIMKKKRKRSASLSDLSVSSSKSFSFSYKEANSAEPKHKHSMNPFARRSVSCSALPFNGTIETVQALRKRVVGLYEKVEFEFQCLRIYAMAELRGAVIATQNFFYLIQNDSIYDDDDDDKEEKKEEDKEDKENDIDIKQEAIQNIEHYKIDWNDIQKVYLRRYIHQEMGIEIIARRGIHFFLILHSDSRETLYDFMLKKCNLREYQSLHFEERMNSGLLYTNKCICNKFMKKKTILHQKKKNDGLKCMETLWVNGLLSNFDYLLYLNEYSGRSFLDVTQYPIFPWVLSDYKADKIDLNDEKTYRDLSVPMGALNKERSRKYVEQFNEWEGRTYHYGTHYSNPAGIFHYLLRIHPYTQQHVELQNGRFDHSDRLFHDLGEMYLHQSKKSFHAVRELSPEFYYFPQFLINGAKYEFGKREHDGIRVNDVILPDWCYNNHYIFIEMNKRALESQYVSLNLHKWIDLIFGYKQHGKHAKESQNLFHPLTYCNNFDIDSFQDDILKQAAIEQVRSFGQAPKQLFNTPHPQKVMIYGNNNEFDKYPSCNIIYHCFNKLYQISVQIYDSINQQFIDIKSLSKDDILITNKRIGYIWCDKLKHSEQYLALLGYERVVKTPIIDFIIRYNVSDGSMRIKRHQNAEKEHIVHGLHTSIISCIAISEDGQTIITGGLDGLLRVWEIKFIKSGDIDTDNHNIDTDNDAEYDNKYTPLINIESSVSFRFELISSTPTHLAPIHKIVISQEYNIIISVSECSAIIWDLINLKVIHILKFKQKIGSVSLQQYRFVISYGSNICVYSIYGEKIASFEPENNNNNNDITELLLPNQSGIILKNTKITFNRSRKQSNLSDVSCCSSTPSNASINDDDNENEENGKEYYTLCHIFSGHFDGMIRIWSLIFKSSLNSFRLIRIAKLRGHCYPITSLNITGNGNILLSGDKNGKLIKWGLSKESLAAFQHLQSNNDDKQSVDIIQRRCTTTDFIVNGDENYGDTESGGITAIQRRAQKDEIKSKYRAFQLHFNNVCSLQETLSNKEEKDKNEYESIKQQLISSLEILKRCKHSLEIAKSSRPKVFCLFDVCLVSFWRINAVLVNKGDSVHFKIIDDVNCIVGCYDNYGKRVGSVSKEQKMALIILMKEGVWFEGVIGKRINDFEIEIHLTGYTWINKQILLNKLHSTIGIDLCKHHKINFTP